jgi:putative lipoprotein (rSAM/lipoprotein system)
MKKMVRPLIKGANWALAGLLSLLGFSGCGDSLIEYGTPHADYTFRGMVTNEAGEPVPDIKVVATATYANEENPVLSNAGGHYSVLFSSIGRIKEAQLIASDIDGETNGAYQNDTIQVIINDSDYYGKGDGHWNVGAAEKEVNIVLKEKK